MLNVYDKCPTLKHLHRFFAVFFFWRGGGRGAEGGEKQTLNVHEKCPTLKHLLQRGWGK